MTAGQPEAAPRDAFELEVVSQMSEADYVQWHRSGDKPRRPRRAFAFRVLFALIALTCFLSWYTVVLGLVLGAIAVAIWTEPHWSAAALRTTYRKTEYLHGPLIYGVSNRGLWFRGGALKSECSWDGLVVWGERDGFLWLSAGGLPQLIFPIAALQRAGIHERIRDLAASHGVEYGSAAANAGRRTERAPAGS